MGKCCHGFVDTDTHVVRDCGIDKIFVAQASEVDTAAMNNIQM